MTTDATLATAFLRDGCAGPFAAMNEAEAAALVPRYCASAGVDVAAFGPSTRNLAAWHQRERWAYDLATRPQILDRVQAVLGPDIVFWAFFAWYKEPRTGKRIPWHQDASYWPIEPKKNVTAWLALGACDVDNGCLRLIPGSHRASVAHVRVDDPSSWFGQGADPAQVDERDARDMRLAPGEFVLFNEATLHGSEPNRSDRPRLALSLRYTSPDVNLHCDRWGDDRVRPFLVRGEDRHGINTAFRVAPPT